LLALAPTGDFRAIDAASGAFFGEAMPHERLSPGR
jgi:hypothetical protein